MRTCMTRALLIDESRARPAFIGRPVRLSARATTGDGLTYQGRLTTALGQPVANGAYTIALRLYDVADGGAALATDSESVTVNGGLFTMIADGFAPFIDGRDLYIGVSVDADPELVPRQRITPVPYAFSLRPGAVVKESVGGAGAAVLKLQNTGVGEGSALWAQTLTTGGNSAAVTAYAEGGASIAIRALGTGVIQSTARSYVWVSGSSIVKNRSSDTTEWDMQMDGAARIRLGATAGSKIVYLPVTIRGPVYGQNVTIESITFYYKVSDAANGYIDSTYVRQQTDADSEVLMIENTTNRTSTTATSYTLTPSSNNTLSNTSGIVSIYFDLSFGNDTDYVDIGGARLTLRHYD